MGSPDDREVNERLDAWRQGDFATSGEHWFIFGIDPSRPLTEAAVAAARQGADSAAEDVEGFVVVSQTCDIVRDCTRRPYLEVCPLVVVAEPVAREAKLGKRPNYAWIPGAANQNLVADLDRVMTVEKSVVATWSRSAGCTSDAERRRLALALARKRSRFAFPDEFTRLVQKLAQRMSSKHDKSSSEGRALRSLREVRVMATPSWDAEEVELWFLFVRAADAGPTFEGRGWDEWSQGWLELVPASDRFAAVEGYVTTLDDMTARDYVESDPLDLDHLTTRQR